MTYAEQSDSYDDAGQDKQTLKGYNVFEPL